MKSFHNPPPRTPPPMQMPPPRSPSPRSSMLPIQMPLPPPPPLILGAARPFMHSGMFSGPSMMPDPGPRGFHRESYGRARYRFNGRKSRMHATRYQNLNFSEDIANVGDPAEGEVKIKKEKEDSETADAKPPVFPRMRKRPRRRHQLVVPAKRRKPLRKLYTSKTWNRQDAERALQAELETYQNRDTTLIIKFPDPEISQELIKSYHGAIEKVHFQVPVGPRYCFVRLAAGTDVDQAINTINNIDFGNLGKLKAERKCDKTELSLDPESIDPYTLYMGNVPWTTDPTTIKRQFPTAARIDVGYAKKIKLTRYAFIRYRTVEEAIEAFKSSQGLVLDSRSIIVRFRRQKGKQILDMDFGTKEERAEKRQILERQRHFEDIKKLMEKRIKKEEKEDEDDLGYILGKQGGSFIDFEDSDEDEEKEVDDDDDEEDDDEDDDEILAQTEGREASVIEEVEEEEEEEEEDEEEDEEEEDEEEDEEDDEDEQPLASEADEYSNEAEGLLYESDEIFGGLDANGNHAE